MAMGINVASWLTARRVRVHGLLLAVCLWSVYAADLATPGLRDRNGLIKGTDFLHFYTLGSIARQDRGELLYDMRAQAELLRKLVPEAAGSLYVPLYGPQVSLLFAPFARLSYGSALTAWLALNVLLYGLCCYTTWRHCPNLRSERWTVLILAIAFPGFFHLIAWGQTSGLALVCFTLAYLALRNRRHFLAGLAIGSLVFKPQLGLAAAVILILACEWKVVAGAVAAALVQLAAGWLHYGTQVMRDYVRALANVSDVLALLEPRAYQMHSLRAFWSLLVPWPNIALVLYLISAIAVLGLAVRCWKSQAPLGIRYATLLFATVLVAPHLTVYDLVLLAPAVLLVGDWAMGQKTVPLAATVRLLLYLCYFSFLLGPLVRFTHLQFSVMTMVALIWVGWRVPAASAYRDAA